MDFDMQNAYQSHDFYENENDPNVSTHILPLVVSHKNIITDKCLTELSFFDFPSKRWILKSWKNEFG